MRNTLVGFLVSTILVMFISITSAQAYPAYDSHGTPVQRLTLKEVKQFWYGYQSQNGMGEYLKSEYNVYGLSVDVWNKNRKEYLTYTTEYNSSMNDELLPQFGAITYLSNDEFMNGQMAVYYNPTVKMYDVYEPGTCAF